MLDDCVDRNLQGIEYEKSGNVDAAIELYEQNLLEDFEGSHPYWRLAIIYHKRKEYDNERRVLKHAIKVFETKVSLKRADRLKKLKRFRERLSKI